MDFGELLNELALSLNALHRRDVCGQGETLAQCFILSSVPDDGIYMSRLAGKLGIDNSTLTRLMENLEKHNLAFRKKDEDDRRLVNVFLTEEGQAVMSRFEARIENLGSRILDDLPPEKRELVKGSLESLLWSLSKELLRTS
jgi:DNA-binding MarR family transcriptional regulator